jgi:hypothetical protein
VDRADDPGTRPERQTSYRKNARLNVGYVGGRTNKGVTQNDIWRVHNKQDFGLFMSVDDFTVPLIVKIVAGSARQEI